MGRAVETTSELRLGELEDALKAPRLDAKGPCREDIKKGLGVSPEDSDLKKSQDRLQKLLPLGV